MAAVAQTIHPLMPAAQVAPVAAVQEPTDPMEPQTSAVVHRVELKLLEDLPVSGPVRLVLCPAVHSREERAERKTPTRAAVGRLEHTEEERPAVMSEPVPKAAAEQAVAVTMAAGEGALTSRLKVPAAEEAAADSTSVT